MRQLQNQINLSEHQFYMNIPQSPAPPNPTDDSEEEGDSFLNKQQMKEIIDSYVKLNDKLMDRIGQLQEQLIEKVNLQSQNQFHQEYSIIHSNADEIQNLILSYRKSLQEYQKKVEGQLKSQKEIICKLEQDIVKMGKQISERSQIIEDLQFKNIVLEQNNLSLSAEIEHMGSQMARRQRGKRNSQNTYGVRDFNQSVQAQLQKLIKKLMEELEYERSSKKKLAIQIKSLQGDILQLEREIISKNSQIYSQQLKALKNSKSNLNLTLANLRPNYSPPLVHNFSFDGEQQKTKRKQKVSNMSLKQVNENDSLGWKQKINLCVKLIDSYIAKFQKKDLTLQDQQSISVQVNDKRSLIRLPNNQQAKSIGSAQMVIENLIQVLEGVVGKKKNRLAWFNPREKNISLIIGNLKSKKSSKVQDLISLREQLREVLDDSSIDQEQ